MHIQLHIREMIRKIYIAFITFLDLFWVKWIFLPGIFTALWVALALLFNPYESFTLLNYGHNRSNLEYVPNKPLLKGQKISGSFVARENNLGIIAIKLKEGIVHHTELEDYLIFRIKEKGQKVWHYESINKIGLSRERYFYTYGFPPIANSNGKSYQFEIVSTKGNAENAIQVLNGNPVFFSKYKVERSSVTKDFLSFSRFLLEKVVRFFLNIDSLLITSIYILPLFFYLAWILFLKKMLFDKKLFIYLTLALIFSDILFLELELASIYFALIDLWIIAIIRNRLSGTLSVSVSFLSLVVCILFIYLNRPFIFHKASTWAYSFLLIGVLVYMWDMGISKTYRKLQQKIKRIVQQAK